MAISIRQKGRVYPARLGQNEDKRKVNDDGCSLDVAILFPEFKIFIPLLISQLELQYSVDYFTFPRNTSSIAEEAEEIR